MDSPDIPTTREIADLVAAAITRAERSKAQVARLIGMPEATFTRKVNGHSDFTIPELVKIANVLHVEPGSLLPSEFRQQSAA